MNRLLLPKLVDEIAKGQNLIYDLVYFYGDRQTLRGVMDAIAEKTENRRIVRTDAENFREETAKTRWGEDPAIPDCDLYIFEEIDGVAGLESNEQRLYGILDWLLENRRQIVISGTAPTAEMVMLAHRIRAQIDGGISFRVE